jgi:hypothetical protein
MQSALSTPVDERQPNIFLPRYIKTESWVATYQGNNIPRIDMDEVKRVHREGSMLGADSDSDSDDSGLSEPPLEVCNAPLTRAPKGRPPKKRLRKGNVKRF